MSKRKSYTISLDEKLMETFKDDCRSNDQKYSQRIEELMRISLSGGNLDNVKVDKAFTMLEEAIDNVNNLLSATKDAIEADPVIEEESREGDDSF